MRQSQWAAEIPVGTKRMTLGADFGGQMRKFRITKDDRGIEQKRDDSMPPSPTSTILVWRQAHTS